MNCVKCSAPTAVREPSEIAEETLVHGVKHNPNMQGSVIREDGPSDESPAKARGSCG